MSINKLINSGLLELYVIGDLSLTQKLLVEKAMENDPLVRTEIAEIEKALEYYAFQHEIPVSSPVKPMILAIADYNERIKNGEEPLPPPSLNENSQISDYSKWLEREDMKLPKKWDSIYGKILHANSEKSTMVVWIDDMAPPETHTEEIEKFLILEGTCDIQIGKEIHSLKKGDYLSIPLFIEHHVKVTSDYPCKAIIERAVA